jgi:hypothetical protein
MLTATRTREAVWALARSQAVSTALREKAEPSTGTIIFTVILLSP